MNTIILLRHADIDPPSGPAPDDWPLNAAGQARAQELVHVVGAAGVTAVFASTADRTEQTVKPLVDNLGLTIRVPTSLATLVLEVRAAAVGGVVLVAGHSNTVPAIIAELGAPFTGAPISGHDDLFVVTILGSGQARVIRLRYGKPSP